MSDPIHATAPQPAAPTAPIAQRFATAVIASAAGHLELPDVAAVARHARSHGSRIALSPALDGREPQLRHILEAVGAAVVVPGGHDPAADAADAEVGLVAGELGIAETGSVLVSEYDLADRVTSMLCHRLVLVVERAMLVDRLEAAAQWLADRPAGAAFAALITGPSRTADIERSLTIGVQGPQEVDVVVVG